MEKINIYDRNGDFSGTLEPGDSDGLGCLGTCLIIFFALFLLGVVFFYSFIDAIRILPTIILFYLKEKLTYWLFVFLIAFNVYLYSDGHKLVKVTVIESIILSILLSFFNLNVDASYFGGAENFVDFILVLFSCSLLALLFCALCSYLAKRIAQQFELIDVYDEYEEDSYEDQDWWI